MARKSESSPYINEQRHAYSLYVMQMRALPAATDGLKAGGRRALWTARDGKKYKSATLAGATMPIHPHASPEGAIDTLAAPYGNNIPLFKGDGAFGTLLNPTAYGASRYTSVTTSTFTDDVVFRDIEIVPMTENYDGTLQEPVHFLPLIPVALLNPAEGIAVGFATNILPRALDDLILGQIAHLKGAKTISNPMPKFMPLNTVAFATEETERGIAYYFNGELTIKDTSTAFIVKLPYGQTHTKVIAKLDDLIERDVLVDYTDRSKNIINIELKFRRGYIKSVSEEDLLRTLGLTVRHIENLNILDFTGKAVWNTTPVEMIRAFTTWRLGWYVQRYERLRDILKLDLQRYYDIRCAIKNNVSALARKIESRSELKECLAELKIVHVDYIADLPIYRFTEEERVKNEQRIVDGEAQLQEYLDMLASEDKRKKVYINELQDVLGKYMKGIYAA
jgi:DNA gyrase/topoisomerase IV subunit A